MPRIFTVDKDKGMRNIIRSFDESTEIVLDIGFFPTGKGGGRHSLNDVPFADIARWNEEGTDARATGKGANAGIPARPFMRSVLDSNSVRYWNDLVVRYLDEIEEGRDTLALKAVARSGRIIANDIQQSIKLWSNPPNAESTEKKKGFNNPLTDFEELQDAVQWKIRRTGNPFKAGGEEEIKSGRA